jgi:hypothetical protein
MDQGQYEFVRAYAYLDAVDNDILNKRVVMNSLIFKKRKWYQLAFVEVFSFFFGKP